MTASVLAVAGAKGGVGKTTTCINLGSALTINGRSAVVVEADLAMANVVDFLDLPVDPKDDGTLHDVLAEEADPADAVYEAPGGLDVLPCGVTLDGYADVDPDAIEGVVDALRAEYDVVILDTGAGVSYETLLPVAVADETILTTTPRAAAVRDTMKTRDLIRRAGGSVRGVVIVKAGTGTAPSANRIADFLGIELLGAVPRDEAVADAQDGGTPLLVHDISAPAAKAYWEAARSLVDGSVEVASSVPTV